MRYVTCTVAIAALAGAVAGCADSSYPGYGYRQTSGYNYPATQLQLSSELRLLSEPLRLRIVGRLQPQLRRNTIRSADCFFSSQLSARHGFTSWRVVKARQ